MSVIQEIPGSIPSSVRNFNSYLGSGKESTQLREDNWVADWYEKYWNPAKKTKIKVERIALR
mgnify:CR=1 FL=1